MSRPFAAPLLAGLLFAAGCGESLQSVLPQASATATTAPQVREGSSWGMLAPMIEPRSEMAAAELEGKVYVLGGYPAGRVPSDVVQVYDPGSNSWSYGPPLPVPMHHAMAAVANDRLFVIGGEFGGAGAGTPSIYLDTVYELDVAEGMWLLRAVMPTGRSGGGTAVIGSTIYVAGGRPPRGHDFAAYDVDTDMWTVLPDLPTQRNHLGVGAVGGKVHVVGGRFGGGVGSEMTGVLEVYDPNAGTWDSGQPLPAPRAGVAAAVAQDCLYVIGGEGNEADPNGMFKENEAYDPRTGSWHQLEPMPIPTHGLTGAPFVNGRILVPGGATTRGGNTGSTHTQYFRPVLDCR